MLLRCLTWDKAPAAGGWGGGGVRQNKQQLRGLHRLRGLGIRPRGNSCHTDAAAQERTDSFYPRKQKASPRKHTNYTPPPIQSIPHKHLQSKHRQEPPSLGFQLQIQDQHLMGKIRIHLCEAVGESQTSVNASQLSHQIPPKTLRENRAGRDRGPARGRWDRYKQSFGKIYRALFSSGQTR